MKQINKYCKVVKHVFIENPTRGFTLIELLIMIVIIGILSAVGILNFNTQQQHSVTVQADELRHDLSHLQLLAISGQGRLQLTVTANGYAICPATVTCNAANAIIDTSTGASFSATLTDGATFISGSGNYYFDSLGRPVTDATSSSLLTTASSFKLNGVGRGNPVTVTVLPITGFAQTSY